MRNNCIRAIELVACIAFALVMAIPVAIEHVIRKARQQTSVYDIVSSEVNYYD